MPRSARDDEVLPVSADKDPLPWHPPQPDEPADEVGDDHGTAPQQALLDRDGEDETGVIVHLDVGPDRRLDIVVDDGTIGAEATPTVGIPGFRSSVSQ